MATTNGIYYPNDGTKAADVLADLKAMAESIDKNIQENKFDDTEIKKDIKDIKEEQQIQNLDIENLQINDNKQDLLISKLKQALINIETEQTKSLHIKDASTIPAQLEVFGNCEQETREGYNLLDVLGNKSAGTTQTVNGVTYTVNKNGSIKVNGTATDNADYFIAGNWGLTEAIIKLNGTYKLQLVDNNNTAIRIYLLNQSSVIASATNSTSLTKTQDVTGWFIRVNAGQTANTTIYPQLVEGTEEKEYEQYGASPSPDYPSSIKCLGNNKNELNLQELEVSNNNGIDTYNIDNANQITLKNKATSSGTPYSYAFQAFKLNLPEGDYNFSAKVESNSNDYRVVVRGKKNGNNITSIAVLNQVGNDGNFNIDYSQCDEYTIELYANQAYIEKIVTTKYYDVKIEKGDVATSYSPPGQGSTKISKINENLFDKSSEGILENTWISQTGETGIASVTNVSDYIRIEGLKSVTINYETDGNNRQLCLYDKNKQVVSSNYGNLKLPFTFKVPETVSYIRFAYYNNADNVELKSENTTTDYIEHEQTDYILDIQEKMLKGDYFVKEDDGWKEVHGWEKYTFTGNETFVMFNEGLFYSSSNIFSDAKMPANNSTVAEIYCNALMSDSYSNIWNKYTNNKIGLNADGTSNPRIVCNQFSTAAEFKEFLQQKYNEGNPVYTYYKTENSTKLACTEEQSAVLDELNNLDLFNGVNNIITAEDIALLKLNYIADTKTYIDNKLNTINQQILNIAGGN